MKKTPKKPITMTIKIDLSTTEGRRLAKIHNQAEAMNDCVYELYDKLFRPHIKYDAPIELEGKTIEMTSEIQNLLWAINQKIHTHLKENDCEPIEYLC